VVVVKVNVVEVVAEVVVEVVVEVVATKATRLTRAAPMAAAMAYKVAVSQSLYRSPSVLLPPLALLRSKQSPTWLKVSSPRKPKIGTKQTMSSQIVCPAILDHGCKDVTLTRTSFALL
jgi:hypothetical protein